MRRILIYMSSGIFLTIAMLLILWTIVLARTAHVQTQDLSVECSQFTDFPWYINNPINCRAYWGCESADSEPTEMECEEGLHFDEERRQCILASELSCEDPAPVDPDPECPEPECPICPGPVDPVCPVDPTVLCSQLTEFPTTRPPLRKNICDSLPDGRLVNNPTGCRSYFECMNGVGLPRQCDNSFNFNEALQICDRPSLTPCTNEDFECPNWDISRWEVPGSCTKFNFCFEGQHRVEECAPGLNFDSEIALCALQEEAGCTRDLCPLNGGIENVVTFPSNDGCEQYYICHGGNKELQTCAPRTHLNQERQRCERPEDARCEIETEPDPIVIECPPGEGLSYLPHPTICQNYFLCVNEVAHSQRCSDELLFDSIDLECKIADRATCAEGATKRINKRKNYFVEKIV